MFWRLKKENKLLIEALAANLVLVEETTRQLEQQVARHKLLVNDVEQLKMDRDRLESLVDLLAIKQDIINRTMQ